MLDLSTMSDGYEGDANSAYDAITGIFQEGGDDLNMSEQPPRKRFKRAAKKNRRGQPPPPPPLSPLFRSATSERMLSGQITSILNSLFESEESGKKMNSLDLEFYISTACAYE